MRARALVFVFLAACNERASAPSSASAAIAPASAEAAARLDALRSRFGRVFGSGLLAQLAPRPGGGLRAAPPGRAATVE
ncbi:MAG TPA: hypothetical protein VLS89_15210, partial [Candidatus Nanopelagicales bacterium]|nr:hypothetical protein [Candidatus Nanopelagicales bacterium]